MFVSERERESIDMFPFHIIQVSIYQKKHDPSLFTHSFIAEIHEIPT